MKYCLFWFVKDKKHNDQFVRDFQIRHEANTSAERRDRQNLANFPRGY